MRYESLISLDVDTTIRERSAGRRSLDDFLHAFYGTENGSFVVKPYAFEDSVNALYPHLIRVDDTPDRLDDILAPR